MSKESEILQAIRHVCDEKGIPLEMVISTIESALAAAYRKDFGEPNQNVQVEFDREKGDYKVYDIKTVVPDFTEEEVETQREELKALREEIQKAREEGKEPPPPPEESDKIFYNPKHHYMLTEAQEVKKDAKEGEEISTKLEVPAEFGRMAAQTAKQVIIQKLREAERSTIYDEFKEKEGEIIVAVVQRREGRNIIMDLGRATGILPAEEQVYGEHYKPGQRLKVYLLSIEMGPKGPVIRVSRSHENIVHQLFSLEIPEISNGAIEIMSIAREAGSRSKVAVHAVDEGIDPIGSCVGQRGTRVQTIINELGGEKVDIIEYQDDSRDYIANALSPAKIISIELNEEEHEAQVTVAEDQLSLAIGRNGQNVRLASKLTGFNINIEGSEAVVSEGSEEEKDADDSEETEDDQADEAKAKESADEKQEDE